MKLPVPRRQSSRSVALLVMGLLLPMQGGCLCGCGVASPREGPAGWSPLSSGRFRDARRRPCPRRRLQPQRCRHQRNRATVQIPTLGSGIVFTKSSSVGILFSCSSVREGDCLSACCSWSQPRLAWSHPLGPVFVHHPLNGIPPSQTSHQPLPKCRPCRPRSRAATGRAVRQTATPKVRAVAASPHQNNLKPRSPPPSNGVATTRIVGLRVATAGFLRFRPRHPLQSLRLRTPPTSPTLGLPFRRCSSRRRRPCREPPPAAFPARRPISSFPSPA